MRWIQLFVGVLAFAGTLMQAASSLAQKKRMDPDEVKTFNTVEEMKTEISWIRHPILHARQRRHVRRLLFESEVEARQYERVRWDVLSWSLLTVAASAAFGIALVGLL